MMKRLTVKQRQWVNFVGLWFASLLVFLVAAKILKFILTMIFKGI